MNQHLSYPVNQFRVLRRALTDWKLILQAIFNSTEPDKEDRLRQFGVVMMGLKDDKIEVTELSNSGLALLRLAQTYKIPLEELPSGEKNDNLIIPDLYAVAKLLDMLRAPYDCSQWVEAAIRRSKTENVADYGLEVDDLLELGEKCFRIDFQFFVGRTFIIFASNIRNFS